jgi:hypothetical protein
MLILNRQTTAEKERGVGLDGLVALTEAIPALLITNHAWIPSADADWLNERSFQGV